MGLREAWRLEGSCLPCWGQSLLPGTWTLAALRPPSSTHTSRYRELPACSRCIHVAMLWSHITSAWHLLPLVNRGGR